MALSEHAERRATACVVPGLPVLDVRYHALVEDERPRHARALACWASFEPADQDQLSDGFLRARPSRSYPSIRSRNSARWSSRLSRRGAPRRTRASEWRREVREDARAHPDDDQVPGVGEPLTGLFGPCGVALRGGSRRHRELRTASRPSHRQRWLRRAAAPTARRVDPHRFSVGPCSCPFRWVVVADVQMTPQRRARSAEAAWLASVRAGLVRPRHCPRATTGRDLRGVIAGSATTTAHCARSISRKSGHGPTEAELRPTLHPQSGDGRGPCAGLVRRQFNR